MKAQSALPVLAWTASVCVVATLAACGRSEGGSTTTHSSEPSVDMQAVMAVPLGDVAGGSEATGAATLPNPYTDNPQAVAQGHDLFVRMNCAGCHGYDAKGGMGPNLTDHYWRYGGAPVSIFKSIYEGRPQGMPAWNPALPPDDIWKLVAYIESLGGSYPASAFQASVQGDRAGDNVAPQTPRTLPVDARKPKPESATAASSPPEARPDAGGKP